MARFLDQLPASNREWELWRKLCGELRELGAVTQSDLDSPQGARETSGQNVLQTIREWGDAYHTLMQAQS